METSDISSPGDKPGSGNNQQDNPSSSPEQVNTDKQTDIYIDIDR